MSSTHNPSALRRFLLLIARLYLTIAFPVLVVLLIVRLVMTPAFLSFEYHRAGFPTDPYGFTLEDRLRYAPLAVEYLHNGAGIEFLGDLTFPDGSPLYNERELRHMLDVKIITQAAFTLAVVMGVGAVFIILALSSYVTDGRRILWRGVFDGALLTAGVIVTIIALAIVGWDTFFTGFHQLFFESGTWYFAYSDTLIRLFPEQFWFDASLLIGGLSLLIALLTAGILWRWRLI